MENSEFMKGAEQIRRIAMTAGEKRAVVKNIRKNSGVVIPLGFSAYGSRRSLIRRHWVASVLALLLLILMGGSSLVSASGGTLPGDALYTLKTNILEPVRIALISSPYEKARYVSMLAIERMEEAESLTARGRMDDSKQRQISDLVRENTTAFSGLLNVIASGASNGNIQAEQIRLDFEAQMNAHAQLLKALGQARAGKTAGSQVSGSQAGRIATVAEETAGSVRFVPAAVPRANMRPSPTSNGNPAQVQANAYSDRRAAIQSLVSSTASDLASMSSSTAPWKQSVASQTALTLDIARQHLDAADAASAKGDLGGSYTELSRAEQAAKQAKIFLDSGLNITF